MSRSPSGPARSTRSLARTAPGKSTLGKIIAGVFPQDQGDLVLRGTTVSFGSPREALDRGIALVAQEVTLVPRLTVAENVFLGAEPRRAGFIDRGSLRDRFDRLVADAGFDLEAGTIGRPPATGQQQQVEILRALAREADLIVLDEPTASLSAKEVERLHEVVRGLRSRGRTVDPRLAFPDRGPRPVRCRHVLRDGRVVRTNPTAQETESSLVTGMLGRPVGRAYPDKHLPPADAPVVLAIEGLSAPGVQDATLSLRAGEIVGLAGLVGAGRSELARAIYGASPATAGAVTSGGAALPGRPAASIDAGSRAHPRVAQGRRPDPAPTDPRERLADDLRRFQRLGFVRRGAERAQVRDALERVDGIAPPRGSRQGRYPVATSRSCSSRGRCSIEPGVLHRG